MQKKFQYLMEREDEANRLWRKDRADNTRRQLLDTGISVLSAKPRIVDAGAGSGVVANQMASIAANIYGGAEIILLDGSRERMIAAKERLAFITESKKRFIVCKLDSIALPDNSADYVFCRFVFEYLINPAQVFSELVRIVKPGGKLVVGDLDQNCMSHFPLEERLQKKLDELIATVEKTNLLDFHAGRKIYGHFYDAKFDNIKVHLYAHHLFYGQLLENDAFNWSKKFDQLIHFQQQNVIDLSFDLAEFKTDFMEFLYSPKRFSYTPLILVEGVKPYDARKIADKS